MSKDFLRNYIKEQNFNDSNNVLNSLKDLFNDVLQEVVSAELDDMLGYEKNLTNQFYNSRNGYSKKTIKSELGTITLNILRYRN
ncbi:transposase [Clostridium perfringens]|uniref:Probable transposase n=1 Tax=Clostridium perfringens (strain 13 / Type A) TaxID=195102 RepID=Q93ME3_CLOPE|nr:probable transposase [Clostridium perfringens str. 13]STB72121.1 transposase [Clostridium perfringens]